MNKKRPVRVYIESESTFDNLKGNTGITDTQLATMILTAGINAIEENGGTVTLPLKMKVEQSEGKANAHPKQAAA